MIRVLISAGALVFLFAASGIMWDVALVGSSGDCVPLPTKITSTKFQWGSAKGTHYRPPVEGNPYKVGVIAAVPGGRILGLNGLTPHQTDIVSVAPGVAPVRLGSFVPGGRPTAAVADKDGNLLVLIYHRILVKVRSDGTELSRHVLLDGTHRDGYFSIDVAADSCTVYLVHTHDRELQPVPSSVRRFNVCTGSFGSDFLGPHTARISAVRLLPRGEVLVGVGMTLQRYDANGALLQTVQTPGWDGDDQVDAIALANEGATAWVSYQCAAPLRHWNLATGELLGESVLAADATASLVARNGWTAAFGAHAFAEAPTLSQIALLTLAAFIAATAVRRLM